MNNFDAGFEAETITTMRPLAVVTAAIGIVFCFIALLIKDLYLGLSEPWLYGCVLVAIAGAWMTHVAKSLNQMLAASLLGSTADIVCFGNLSHYMTDTRLWFLPVGLCVTLTVAPLYHHVTQFVAVGAVLWAVLAWVVKPHFSAGLEYVFVMLIIFGSLCAGATMSILFRYLRRQSYDLQCKLYVVAHVDALTGLPNRRAFMSNLTQILNSPRQGKCLHFLMLDIDDFKKINDHFGHDVGDLALKEVAKILETQAAGHNFGRLGGEEFAVAAQLDVADARVLAQGIVQAVNASFIKDRRLSLSIGIAKHRNQESDASLMRCADEALYEAKRTGKNRYVMAHA